MSLLPHLIVAEVFFILKRETMSEKLFIEIDKLFSFQIIQDRIKKENSNLIYVSALPESFRVITAARLKKDYKQILILSEDFQKVREVKVELNTLGVKENLIYLDELNSEKIQETITKLNKQNEFILVAPYKILISELPSKEAINKNTTLIEMGGNIGYDELIEYLNLLNYNKDKFVEEPGFFAIRGSIIDFWSYSEKRPVRLEYDGDFLESIRIFDPESQRSSNKIEQISLAPMLDAEIETKASIFDYLSEPLIFASETELQNIFDIESEKKVKNDIDLDEELKEEIFSSDLSNTEEKNEIVQSETITSVDALFKHNAKWIIEDELGKNNSRLKLNLKKAPAINSNFKLLFLKITEFIENDFRLFITVENELHGKKLYDLLIEAQKDFANYFDAGKIKIIPFGIRKGFIEEDNKIVVLTDYQIFNKPFRTKLSTKKKYKRSHGKELASLKNGDYVVHETFGIGRYAGLSTIKIGNTEQESIKLIYANDGVVYVNLNYFSLIKRFSSNEDAKPKLSVLGSNEWKNTKKKIKKKIQEAARDLILLYAKRKSTTGFGFSPDTIWQKELEASFLYEDTPDQAKVTEDVKNDMQSEHPMDRLVCGDVGFGKTEIAVRAAFKAVEDGMQVALLVPTTILAEQHYNTFKDRLSQFPVSIHVLSRFRSKATQQETLDSIATGTADIVIGTHRLLSKDVKFKNLGILIIDEEHRFGVMAKEKLRQLKANVDTLTLTATPIPRTLNMSLLGARDLSIIATPPPNRLPIYTKVETFDVHKIRQWVLDEIKRDGQVFFIHDRVHSIDKMASYLKRYIPEIKIGIAHGQMKPAQLEKVIYDFLNKEYQMLLATKIIESGIDIPNANTIIINRADRFGLAELHQLRGRVGRSSKKAFAYFLVPSLNTITKKAVRRLQAIEENADVGGGFNLAMRDLEIRGAGNLLGTEQSGSINTVGFDMYVKLLDEAVEELRNSEFKELFKDLPKSEERTEPTIDTFFEIGIPKQYMPEQADRLSYYTALFSINKIDELPDIKEEIEDKYGRLPDKVELLILAAELRYFASRALFDRIVITNSKISYILPKGKKEIYYQEKLPLLMKFIMEKHSKSIQFQQGKDAMKLVMKNNFTNQEDMLKYVIDFCKAVKNLINEKINK